MVRVNPRARQPNSTQPIIYPNRSFAGRTRSNPPNPQVIGLGIGFEFLDPFTREFNSVIECIFERCCRTIT
jgi:hypothetical protein